MAINIDEQYPGKTAGTSSAYPYGEARNVTTPGDGTGTPWEKAIVNDDQGFKQALLTAAGILPSGAPDTALVSQYLQALQALFAGAVSFSGDSSQWALKLKFPSRTLCIKGGNVDYTSNPGEIAVTTAFTEAFPTVCASVISLRKMATHSTNGDGGVLLVGTPTPNDFRVSLQAINSTATSDLRGFSWVAFGW